MSEKVDVRSIYALEDMANTLHRVQTSAKEIITAASYELSFWLDWIAEKEQDANYQVSQSESLLEDCIWRLNNCEQSGYEDDDGEWVYPDCSDYSYAVNNADRSLREDIEKQQKVANCAYHLRQAAEDFSLRARNFQAMATDHMDGARFFLQAKIEALRHFLALTTPDSVSKHS
ncbi:MAG: hypothetical protein J0665_14485 [Deltaproteobacteria bacterium]|nr:hypothetical protein [Deltaproteobacteria bacterium]